MPEGAENAAPIDRRGWCIFERKLSCMRKAGHCFLALSQAANARGPPWLDLQMACQAGREAPLAPDAFEAMLRAGMAREAEAAGTGFRFTNGKDATEICIPQYRDGFLRLMAMGGVLNYANLGWGDAEAATLAAALAYAHANGATSQAFELSLSANQLTDAALPPLVEVIEKGALPELETLALDDNAFTDAAVVTLRPLLAGRLSSLVQLKLGSRLTAEGVRTLVALLADGHLRGLQDLDLQNNRALGDGGATALAAALAKGWLPELKELRLNNTGMGDAGAAALADALGGAPALAKLVVGKNAFGEGAAEALKAACAARGVAAMSDPFDAL